MGIRLEDNCCQFLFPVHFLKIRSFTIVVWFFLGEFPRLFLEIRKICHCYSLTIYYVSRREHLLPTDFKGWIFLS
jgi:hypothetical protein